MGHISLRPLGIFLGVVSLGKVMKEDIVLLGRAHLDPIMVMPKSQPFHRFPLRGGIRRYVFCVSAIDWPQL